MPDAKKRSAVSFAVTITTSSALQEKKRLIKTEAPALIYTINIIFKELINSFKNEAQALVLQ